MRSLNRVAKEIHLGEHNLPAYYLMMSAVDLRHFETFSEVPEELTSNCKLKNHFSLHLSGSEVSIQDGSRTLDPVRKLREDLCSISICWSVVGLLVSLYGLL